MDQNALYPSSGLYIETKKKIEIWENTFSIYAVCDSTAVGDISY